MKRRRTSHGAEDVGQLVLRARDKASEGVRVGWQVAPTRVRSCSCHHIVGLRCVARSIAGMRLEHQCGLNGCPWSSRAWLETCTLGNLLFGVRWRCEVNLAAKLLFRWSTRCAVAIRCRRSSYWANRGLRCSREISVLRWHQRRWPTSALMFTHRQVVRTLV